MKSLITIFLALCLVAQSQLDAQSLPRQQNDPIPGQLEAMYTRGLRFLSQSQNENGAWGDQSGSRRGVVALCTIAMLAHGDDPNTGPYAGQISRCIGFLVDGQNSNGFIGPQMYDHGFATLALAECYGMVDDPRIAPALKNAVDLILSAQKHNSLGGWRYSPTDKHPDTTVTGCQIVALMAARNAGIPVPDAALQKAIDYMKSCCGSNGSFGYTSNAGGRVTLTAIGNLCLSLTNQTESNKFKKSLEYLKKEITYQDSSYPYYFMYYMSQALFQADEDSWQVWNANHIRLLAATQLPDGSWAGNRGNAYSTAGALLSLALNYRFLPIYEK